MSDNEKHDEIDKRRNNCNEITEIFYKLIKEGKILKGLSSGDQAHVVNNYNEFIENYSKSFDIDPNTEI